MNAIKIPLSSTKRLLNLEEACIYISQGKTKGRQWLNSIHADVRFGRRVVYDKNIIDRTLDCLIQNGMV